MVQNDKPIVKFLNIMVLLSSILVLVIISIELLSATTILSERFILNTHLMVCTIFLADFFVRWYFSQEGWHFLGHHIFLLLISIPYLNIVYISSAHLSHATWVLLRLIPIARGIYGISIIQSVRHLSVHRLCYHLFLQHHVLLRRAWPKPHGQRLLGCLQLVIDERHYRRFQHLRRHKIRPIAGCYPSRFRHGIFSDFHCIRSGQLPEKAERSGNTDTQLILKT